MMATFVAEFCMAVYVLWRHKLDAFGRLVTLTLICLGLFQLAEYFVCGGAGLTAGAWARLGYAAITALPPLGLHILYKLGNHHERRLVWFAYVTMVGFWVYFLTMPGAIRGHECTGNYVIFQLGERASIMYGYYYYGWLLAAVSLGVRWLSHLHARNALTKLRRDSIRALIVGYLTFLLPTGLANSVNPETRKGIPSIMCGFAVLFALILTFYILPRARKLKI